jgi:hypothetical protein
MVVPDQPQPPAGGRKRLMTEATDSRATHLTYETVRRVCGDIPDWKVA